MTLQGFLRRLIWLCVLPLLAVAAYLAYLNVRSAQEQVEREAARLAANVAHLVDQELREEIKALQLLAGSPLADDPARLEDFYREAQIFRETLGTHVVFADMSMQMLFNTRAPFGAALPKLPRPKGKIAVDTVLETGKPAVGDIVFGPVANQPLIAVAAPVTRDGAMKSLLFVTIETSYFQKLLDKVALPEGWIIALHDSTGTLLAERTSLGRKAQGPHVMHQGHVLMRLEITPWQVELDVPPEAYRAPYKTVALPLAAAIVLAAFTAFWGGASQSRRLSQAVETLTGPTTAAAPATRIVEIEAVRQALTDAEAKEREALLHFRAMFEQAAVGIAQIGLDGRYHRVNRKLCEFTGYDRNELLAKTFQEITLSDDLDTTFLNIHQLVAHETDSYAMEKRYVRKDGAVVWARVTVSLVRDPAGTPLYLIAIYEDVTGRKRAELALNEHKARLQDFFDHAGDAIFIVNSDRKFIDVNPEGLRMLGYEREEMSRLEVLDTLAEHERERLGPAMAKTREGVHNLEEWVFLRKDGTTFPAEVSARAYGQDRFIALVRDLTARKEAEQLQLQMQKMDALGSLAGGIAHDINNMLLPILNLVPMVARTLPEGGKERKKLDMAMQAARRIKDMVARILMFSRGGEGASEDIDIAKACGDALGLLRMTLPTTIDIRTALDTGTGRVSANAKEVEAILMNLASNAAAAMEGRTGVLEISLTRIAADETLCAKVPSLKAGPYARLTVSDTGSGMDKETLKRIFDPFFTTKPSGKGTGMGLAMVFGTMTKYGGAISVASEVGKGTTFDVYFPLLATAPEPIVPT